MPKQAPPMAELFEKEKRRQLEMYGTALAARLGPPPGGKRMSDAKLVEKFLQRDPAVTPEMIEQARAQGATPDDITAMLHPYRAETYTVGVIGTENQIKEAERLAKLAAKQTAPQPEFLAGSLGPLPQPAQAAPMMPEPQMESVMSEPAPMPEQAMEAPY